MENLALESRNEEGAAKGGKQKKEKKPKKVKEPKEKKPAVKKKLVVKGSEKEKKPKKAKEPKAPKTPKAHKPKDGAQRKGRSNSGLGTLILVLFILVLLGMTAVCYLYNFFNFKTSVIAFFASQDDQYQQMLAEAKLYDEDITKKYEELEAAKAELEAREAAADAKDAQLLSREDKLKAQDEEYKKNLAALNSGQMDFDNIVETVSSMSAKNAASMLLQFSNMSNIARVLSAMDPTAVGKILKEMPAEVAAGITEILIYLSDNAGAQSYQPSYNYNPQTPDDQAPAESPDGSEAEPGVG